MNSSTKSADAGVRNSDRDAVAVVVGASRGIGLAITQKLFGRFDGRVVALCRNPQNAGALGALFQFNPHRMHIAQVDVTNDTSVEKAVAEVKQFGNGRVDIVVNCAGFLHDVDDSGAMPETSLSKVDEKFLKHNLEVR